MRENISFNYDKSNVFIELVVFEIPSACKKANFISFFTDILILFFNRKMKSFFDFLFNFIAARFNQSDNRLLIIAVKEIVDNFGSSRVPIKDDSVI